MGGGGKFVEKLGIVWKRKRLDLQTFFGVVLLLPERIAESILDFVNILQYLFLRTKYMKQTVNFEEATIN